MTCSAEGYRFLSSNTIDKNVQEIFQIPTVRSDRTRALFNSLHGGGPIRGFVGGLRCGVSTPSVPLRRSETDACGRTCLASDRKSTRLNSSHANISYAVFCLKKKDSDYTRSPGFQPELA